MEFEGLKRDDDGVYHYDDDELSKTNVPLSENVEGDTPLDHDKLEELFGFTEDSLPELPRYLISPNLHSNWGGTYEADPDVSWFAIKGNVAVYKPVEWVVSVSRVKDWSEGDELQDVAQEEIEGPIHSVYAPAELALEIPDDEGSLRAPARIKEEVIMVDVGDLERRITDDVIGDEDAVGESGAVELVLGVMLRVEEVYVHQIPEVWLDDRRSSESLNWSGGPGWEEIRVSSDHLANVAAPQFAGPKMIGEGHSDSFWIAGLPVIEDENVQDLHIALSCSGWQDWYAYVVGEKGESGGEKLVAYPQVRPVIAVVAGDQLD